MAGRAFYISLGVCLLAAGAVGFSSMKNMSSPKTVLPEAVTEKTSYVNYGKHIYTDPPTTVPAETPVDYTELATEPFTAAVFDSGNEPLAESTTAEEEPSEMSFSSPLSLEIGADYSRGVPVFSSTMSDYRTHNGVDFLGVQGDTVKPIAEGTVTAVTKDAVWGNSVTVDHGNGVVSKISGLSDNDLIEEGEHVHENAVLGRVGTVPVEADEPSHIHLEIRVNGKLADPLEWLGFDGADEAAE